MLSSTGLARWQFKIGGCAGTLTLRIADESMETRMWRERLQVESSGVGAAAVLVNGVRAGEADEPKRLRPKRAPSSSPIDETHGDGRLAVVLFAIGEHGVGTEDANSRRAIRHWVQSRDDARIRVFRSVRERGPTVASGVK